MVYQLNEAVYIRSTRWMMVFVENAELVTASVANSNAGYGYHIRVDHSDGSMTVCVHFVEGGIMVSTCLNVKMGEMAGCSGNTKGAPVRTFTLCCASA